MSIDEKKLREEMAILAEKLLAPYRKRLVGGEDIRHPYFVPDRVVDPDDVE